MTVVLVFIASFGASCGFFCAIAIIDTVARLAKREPQPTPLATPTIRHEITASDWEAVGHDLSKALGYGNHSQVSQYQEAERPALRLMR